MLQYDLYFWDILQAYVKSITHLNRKFFMHLLVQLGLPGNVNFKIIKSLYGVSKAENHLFISYHFDQHEKLSMTQLTYDPCLLYTKNSSSSRFRIIGFQTDDILFLAYKIFIVKKEKQLYKTNLLAKKKR